MQTAKLSIHRDEFILVTFSILVVVVNKYVLSVLHFTKPTVFQGWQTFVCVISLTCIMRYTRFRLDIQELDRRTISSLIVPFVCFTLGNVAGSKALADMPIGMFLASSNVVTAGLSLVRTQKNTVRDAASISIVISVIILHFISPLYPIAWFWMLVNILSQQIQQHHLADHKLSSVTIVYYCNFSSVILLLPLSVYLQEATSAIHHAQQASIEFFFGCLTSGVLGTGLQLVLATLEKSCKIPLYQGVAKIFACILSLLLFENELSPFTWGLIVINFLIASVAFNENEVPDKVPLSEMSVI